MNLGPARVGITNQDNTNENVPEKPKTPAKQNHTTKNKSGKQKKSCRVVGRNVVESHYYEIAIIVLTFIALFMEDVEILLLTSPLWDTTNYGRS